MSFPVNPKNGLIYKHRNGLTYVFTADTGSWDILHEEMTPVAGVAKRTTRGSKPALKPAPATVTTNATTTEVINEFP